MSTIKVDTIQNTSGVEVYTAKAWVNFNGTGTVAIRGSGNISSLTDAGAGEYVLSFSSSMATSNYENSQQLQVTSDATQSTARVWWSSSTTSSIKVGNTLDMAYYCVSVRH